MVFGISLVCGAGTGDDRTDALVAGNGKVTAVTPLTFTSVFAFTEAAGDGTGEGEAGAGTFTAGTGGTSFADVSTFCFAESLKRTPSSASASKTMRP